MNFINALNEYNEMLKHFGQSSSDMTNDKNSTTHTEPVNNEEI